MKEDELYYYLNVVCSNCGKRDTIKIPRGTKFKGVGIASGSDYDCKFCGCDTLINEDW